MSGRKKLGELLIEAKAVSEDDIRVALGQQKAYGHRQKLGQVLLALSYTNTGAIARALAIQYELPFIELPAEIPAAITAIVPVDYQCEHRIVPFGVETEGKVEKLLIAVDDPAKMEEVDDLRFQLRKTLRVFVASASDLDNTLSLLRGEKVEEIVGIALDDEEAASARTSDAVPEPEPAEDPWSVGKSPATPSDWDLPALQPKDKAAAEAGPGAAQALDALLGDAPVKARPSGAASTASAPAPVAVLSFPPRAEAPRPEGSIDDAPRPPPPPVEAGDELTPPEQPKRDLGAGPAQLDSKPAVPTDAQPAPSTSGALTAAPAPAPMVALSEPLPAREPPLPADASRGADPAPEPPRASSENRGQPFPGSLPKLVDAIAAVALRDGRATEASAPTQAEPSPSPSPSPSTVPKLEFTEDDLKMLDAFERIASNTEPLKPAENLNANYMIFTLIRLLIHKGVIREDEILEELARK